MIWTWLFLKFALFNWGGWVIGEHKWVWGWIVELCRMRGGRTSWVTKKVGKKKVGLGLFRDIYVTGHGEIQIFEKIV